MPFTHFLLSSFGFLIGGATVTSQEDSVSSGNQNTEKTIRFSTIMNTRQESLQPYYEALKNAEYGRPRFSVIEQLAKHHIEKGNSDSILHYGNMYLKEISNWDEIPEKLSAQAAQAYYILGEGTPSILRNATLGIL